MPGARQPARGRGQRHSLPGRRRSAAAAGTRHTDRGVRSFQYRPGPLPGGDCVNGRTRRAANTRCNRVHPPCVRRRAAGDARASARHRRAPAQPRDGDPGSLAGTVVLPSRTARPGGGAPQGDHAAHHLWHWRRLLGAATMSEARALGLLRALCSGLTPGGIEVVADDQRTAFVPKRKRIMVARRFLSADTPVGIGALLHEVGHVLVTRYHLFTEPPDVPQALWWQALNAVEETRVHRFLRRRLPGVGGYLDALFAMDEAPGPDAFESDLVVFLAATAAWDRHPSLPFLAGFPAAEAAFHRTEPARSSYTRTLPPPELMPLPNLDQRYERLVLSGLEAPALVAPALVAPALVTTDSGSVVPLEAEVRCAAASALRVFGAGIWPEIMALAVRDQARIARSVADDPDLRLAAERDDAEAVREHPVLARQALRAWMDAHGTEQAPEPHPDGDLAKLAWGLLRRYLKADRSLQQSHRSAGPMRGRIRAKGARDTDDLSSAGFSEAREPPAGQPMAEETQRARSALVDVLRRAVPPRPVRWTSGHRSGTAIDLVRAMLAAAT